MPTPAEWQTEQRATATATVAQLLALWGRIDPSRIGPSWDRMLPRAVDIVTRAQVAAATGAADYVNETIARQTSAPGRADPVRAAALGGVASDGRPLDTLLTLPASQAGRATRGGYTTDAALAGGRNALAGIAATQVLDAGRLAAGIGVTTHPQAGGYRRQLTTPSCSRCVILAGKWYRWNQGFQRHPKCDCVHVPSVGPKSDYAGTQTFDPQSYFESLTAAEQDRIFTKAGAQAIRDGADMNQVVNARRGMRTTTAYGKKIRTTSEGTTRRGLAARRMATELDAQFVKRGGRYSEIRVPRLMPEQIYADARDRDDAIRLLRRFGFI